MAEGFRLVEEAVGRWPNFWSPEDDSLTNDDAAHQWRDFILSSLELLTPLNELAILPYVAKAHLRRGDTVEASRYIEKIRTIIGQRRRAKHGKGNTMKEEMELDSLIGFHATFFRARQFFDERDYRECVVVLERTAKAKPNNAQVRKLLADALYITGDKEKCPQHYEAAALNDSKSALPIPARISCLLRLVDLSHHSKALGWLRKAFSWDSSNPHVLVRLMHISKSDSLSELVSVYASKLKSALPTLPIPEDDIHESICHTTEFRLAEATVEFSLTGRVKSLPPLSPFFRDLKLLKKALILVAEESLLNSEFSFANKTITQAINLPIDIPPEFARRMYSVAARTQGALGRPAAAYSQFQKLILMHNDNHNSSKTSGPDELFVFGADQAWEAGLITDACKLYRQCWDMNRHQRLSFGTPNKQIIRILERLVTVERGLATPDWMSMEEWLSRLVDINTTTTQGGSKSTTTWRVELAESLDRQGKRQEAIAALEKAFEIDGTDSNIAKKLGDFAIEKSDWDKAVKVYTIAATKFSHDQNFLDRFAFSCMHTKPPKVRQALQLYMTTSALHPNSVDPIFKIAKLQFEEYRDWPEATRSFKQVLSNLDKKLDQRVGELSAKDFRFDSLVALAMMRDLETDWEGLRSLALQGACIRPLAPTPQYQLAKSHWLTLDYDSASLAISKAISLCESKDNHIRSMCLSMQGGILFQQHRPKEGAVACQLSREADPTLSFSFTVSACLAAIDGESIAIAQSFAKSAITMDAEDLRARSVTGYILLLQNKTNEALTCLGDAVDQMSFARTFRSPAWRYASLVSYVNSAVWLAIAKEEQKHPMSRELLDLLENSSQFCIPIIEIKKKLIAGDHPTAEQISSNFGPGQSHIYCHRSHWIVLARLIISALTLKYDGEIPPRPPPPKRAQSVDKRILRQKGRLKGSPQDTYLPHWRAFQPMDESFHLPPDGHVVLMPGKLSGYAVNPDRPGKRPPAPRQNAAYIDIARSVSTANDMHTVNILAPSLTEELLLKKQDIDLGKILGSGGFGTVYAARLRHSGRKVAVKVFHGIKQLGLSERNEILVEIESITKLNHPSIIKFYGACLDPSFYAVATDLCEIGSLYAYLHGEDGKTERELPWRYRRRLAVQIAEGVAFLHSRNPRVIHRDLKSLNIVLDRDLCPKICDFGLTYQMDPDKSFMVGGQGGGSPRYMAPETYRADGKITEKVDVWALGCILIEVFGGRVPFADCLDPQHIAHLILVEKKGPGIPRKFPPELQVIVYNCLQFDHKIRWDAVKVLRRIKQLPEYEQSSLIG